MLFAGGMQTPASLLVLGHGLAADPTLEAMEAMEAIYGNTDQVSRLRLTIVGEGAAVKMDGVMELALA
ncbi:MAG: hypothetical protein GWM93_08390, partial [Gemmatimonadetes bacterium]|nr:hypothetical protein [Gemmatimonadota bacterium]NIT66683.1 hypothetical protein [Gemmatimonadota bacterium]NIY35260.1 hypothetical protein [Gemmatimonadota bacterium]